ncbi:hypothetical protein GCM10022377_02080 [Zhihengliuella alba]|uniref:Spore protein YkvP/CgeB glycosyl transferase-like domain-containing protein n=1 Tax=Zhihengliuella alba TaxID=547018 RepID=A0ABP7CR17_9MICC
MKFLIFDGILETHVASSLERALRARGHEVSSTGKIGHGFKFLTDSSQLAPVNAAIDAAIDSRPDVIFVFRPASLPYPELRRLKGSGATLIAWLSDDPVLWKLSYGPIVDLYDLILHCGNETVLKFYEEKHGRPTGVNFPFWTDGVSFPYVYGSRAPESDVMFLGNVNDQVRRDRYFSLSSLDLDLRIHGNVGTDYNKVWGGYLDSDREVVDAGARTKLAINIPQYFQDHRGLETWFDGLAELGFFEFPSRVIQYAAMGIPLVSFVPEGASLPTFPEIFCVSDAREAEATAKDLLKSGELSAISQSVRRRFEANFSAASRVLALEYLLQSDDWRALDVVGRARLFTEFDGSTLERQVWEQSDTASGSLTGAPPSVGLQREAPENYSLGGDERIDAALVSHFDSAPLPVEKLNIALVGTGWGDHLSTLNTTRRGLENLGHEVTPVNPYNFRQFITPDPMGEFSGIVDLSGLYDHFQTKPDVFLFVGGYYLPAARGVARMRDAESVETIVLGLESAEFTLRDARLVSIVDRAYFVNMLTPSKFRQRGLENVGYYPDGFDRSYVRLLMLQKTRYKRVGILAQRDAHFALNRHLLEDFHGLETARFAVDSGGSQKHGLANAARIANSLVSIVLPDTSRKGPLPNRLLGHAMISGSLPVLMRGIAPAVITSPGEDCLVIGQPGELRLKIHRLMSDEGRLENLRLNSIEFARRHLAVEENLVEALGGVASVGVRA